jgi:hypothetical protein
VNAALRQFGDRPLAGGLDFDGGTRLAAPGKGGAIASVECGWGRAGKSQWLEAALQL